MILEDILKKILHSTAQSGVPLGINVESVSIGKAETEAAHTLFQVPRLTLRSLEPPPNQQPYVRWSLTSFWSAHRTSRSPCWTTTRASGPSGGSLSDQQALPTRRWRRRKN